MAVTVRVVLNSPGIRSLVSSSQMQEHMEAVASGIAARALDAGIKVEGEPGDVALPIEMRKPDSPGARAHAWVVITHPSGLAVEAKHRVLGGALPSAATTPSGMVSYTTRSGATRLATQAQADAWFASRTT